jgi:hypothetical protein
MLRLSKHSEPFFSNLLVRIMAGTIYNVDQLAREAMEVKTRLGS